MSQFLTSATAPPCINASWHTAEITGEFHCAWRYIVFLTENVRGTPERYSQNSFPHKINKANRPYSNIDIRNTVYTVIGVGVMANALLLLVHISFHITGHRPKPTDLPIGLLALIHLAILLIKGFIASDIFIPQGGRWDDLTCKLLIYLYRLMRGFSICATYLLSVLQAITLSPRNSCLAKFKHKYSPHILCFLLFLWHSLSTLIAFSEASLRGIISISNGYMVGLLCRHKRQSRRLHSTSLPPVSSPELRATQTILLLLSCFMVMSILDSIVSYGRITLKHHAIFYCIQILLAHSYASFSPLVFISTEKSIISILRYIWMECPHRTLKERVWMLAEAPFSSIFSVFSVLDCSSLV
ncbi:vomeronasal type-1 receptor 45-like [Callospermophilus lateralis]|uniref:vomeronasal type-1 receptor 45-like n=1 Tax=Callospermophilus lateralis TaxID=76772 RepID=UPI004038EA63